MVLHETFGVIELSDELCEFRKEVRDWLNLTLIDMPYSQKAKSWMGFSVEFSKLLAHKNWLGLTIPKRFGGAGKSFLHRFVLTEELLCAGAPVSAHWIADRQSAPLILHYGTEAQKSFFLPKICKAEAFFCIGMSEPNSGSDLASIQTRAVKTNIGWCLNGSKIWTTNADKSDYMLALVRTSGDSKDRQQGLSQMIIDLSLKGISIRPIKDLSGESHFAEVFFDNVELTSDSIIGDEGKGWEQVTAELAFERSGPERLYSSIALLQSFIEESRNSELHTKEVKQLIGRVVARLGILRMMSLSLAMKLHSGYKPSVEAAIVKDYGTLLEQDIPQIVFNFISNQENFNFSLDFKDTLNYILQMSPTYSLRGGTREILRGIIAKHVGLR